MAIATNSSTTLKARRVATNERDANRTAGPPKSDRPAAITAGQQPFHVQGRCDRQGTVQVETSDVPG